MTCTNCARSDVIKYGTRNGLQIYYCKSCGIRFTDNGAEPGRRLPAEHVGAAITMFYDGLSTGDSNAFQRKPKRSTWEFRRSGLPPKIPKASKKYGCNVNG